MSETEMKIDPARAKALVSQLQAVNERVAAVSKGRSVRVVAVSKLKPANDILALHESELHHLHFGENYYQELSKKAELLPKTIRWHFIGGLQTSHCKPLARIPNLWCVSSVDTAKKAQQLSRARGVLRERDPSVPPLGVHVQVNTSGEASKSGCAPGADTVALCRLVTSDGPAAAAAAAAAGKDPAAPQQHEVEGDGDGDGKGAIAEDGEGCPHLRLLGLMTIGAIARSVATTPGSENEDFAELRRQRALVAAALGLRDEDALELSMGMSEDFEGAVAMGSGEVRVGSTIFGERPAKADAKITV